MGCETTYEHALRIAEQAALDAGALLRREFHRPGGPLGNKHKTPADCEAERLIRERLTGAFPTWGLRGEELPELDRPSRDEQRHLWLVDPNDGTSAFYSSQRGAAVSIGLVRDGVPVLGVVYAYAAPDDRGELFCWAEGVGPVRRNGVAVAPRLPDVLESCHTVLVSHQADTRSLANAIACAPARYRTMPSIAYRLALVAAGEAAAATSIFTPQDYDVAGGHALLRGAGGDLYDEQGDLVRYCTERATGLVQCFGGSDAVARELAARPWSGMLSRPVEPSEAWSFAMPVRGELVADAGALARAQGALLGQLAGDALGSLVEFQRPDAIERSHPGGVRALRDGGTHHTIAGQPTDDSEMALLLARAIVAQGGFDDESAAEAYAWWFSSQPFDMGGTTATALGPAAAAPLGQRAAAAQRAASRSSQANGALMRVSPLGVLGWQMEAAELIDLARRDAALTHPHPVCRDASAVFAATVARAVREGGDGAALYAFAVGLAEQEKLHDDVRASLDAAARSAPSEFVHQMGWVRIALQNAYFQLLHASGLEAGVVDTVRRGGDTDTNGCIAGALLGARWGRSEVPQQWAERVLTCRPIAGLSGVVRPRPKPLWPVDALTLAERLLVLGARQASVSVERRAG